MQWHKKMKVEWLCDVRRPVAASRRNKFKIMFTNTIYWALDEIMINFIIYSSSFIFARILAKISPRLFTNSQHHIRLIDEGIK